VELRLYVITRGWPGVRLYAHKASAKRAAQRTIDRVLGEDLP
jgi:hypothetical protein